jgi:hypothetical protein
MASSDNIAALRLLTDEPSTTPYSDAVLSARIDAAGGDVRAVAADIWREKAAGYATLVDISEAGSSRKNSQLYSNALSMAASFDAPDAELPPVYSTTRPIRRV